MQPSRRFHILGGAAIVIVLGLALGIGLGVGLNKDDDNNSSSAQSSANNDGKANVGDSTKSAVSVTPFSKWSFMNQKMNGMALGNWLVLERWMDEDWFTGLAGSNAWDEWTFTEAVGSNASTALTEHWNNWITEADVAAIAQAGFNHLRIPVGFWAFIPTEGDEPYVTSGQIAQIDRIAEAAYKNKLYVLLDLHGMPGNQNGEQQSGQNTSSIQFYTDANQARSDATLQAAISYIEASPYSSIFSGIGIVNEPHPWTQDQLDTLEQFYERSYSTLSAKSIPMIFHHAFQGLDYWRSFLAGKDPSLVIAEDHPYPGNFPLQDDADDIIKQVCEKASGYATYPVPVAVTEWSLTTGIDTSDFEKQFFRAQSTAWDWSGGSTFWAYKTIHTDKPVLANATQLRQYSYVDLVQDGSLEPPSTWANDNSQPPCGSAPSVTWASPVPAASTTAASHFRNKRSKRAKIIH